MNRRALLRAALVVPLALAGMRTGVAKAGWRVIVRTPGGVVALDPTTGISAPLRLPDTVRQAQWHPDIQRLLLDLGDDVVIRDPRDAVPDRTLPAPFSVVAGRVIGADETLFDLVTDRWHRLPDGFGPDIPTLRHPTRLAAALDGRAGGGPLIALPDDPNRSPWVADLPIEASVAMGADGRSLLVALPDGVGFSLHCLSRHHPIIDRPLAQTDEPLALLGPVGASAVVLAQVGEAALALLDADGQGVIVPMPGPGRVTSWQSDCSGKDLVVAWEAGGDVGWWHFARADAALRPFDALPPNLVMAGLPGGAQRWVHGASARRDGLGSGELRLLAVAPESAELVLDASVDRRLELAATAVRDDGAVLAHVQAGNTRVDIDVAALPGPMRPGSVLIDTATAAASEIDLRVEGDVVAAGLRWGDPDHHAPIVVALKVDGGEAVTIEGELVGLVPSGAIG